MNCTYCNKEATLVETNGALDEAVCAECYYPQEVDDVSE